MRRASTLAIAALVSFALWCFAAPWALAAEPPPCYQWKPDVSPYNTAVAPTTEAPAAIAAYVAYVLANPPTSGSFIDQPGAVSNCEYQGVDAYRCQVRSIRVDGPAAGDYCATPSNCGDKGFAYYRVIRSTAPEGFCDGPCTELSGQDAFVGMNAGDGTGTYCNSNGCQVDVPAPTLRVTCSASGVCSSQSIYKSTYSGQSCAMEDEDVTEGDCTVGPFGRMCVEETPTGQNCGELNGERVCVESISSGCRSYASGSVACVVEGEGATDQVPDNGTEGVPATPDMQVAKDGKVVNYYNKNTVSNSSSSVVTNNSSGTGSGDGAGNGDGDGEGLDDLEGPELGEVDGFGGVTSEFLGRVGGSDLLQAVEGLTNSWPTGSCPNWSTHINAGVTEFDMDFGFICGMWDDIAGVISAVMLAAWAWLAVRILMSA